MLSEIIRLLSPPPEPLPEPELPMGTVTKSIGTTGRNYSTITLWEADLDNAAVYAAGDIARGECYNDSAFDESVTINGGGTVGLASRTLTVASGQRHSGTAGTGARIHTTSLSGTGYTLRGGGISTSVEWLEISSASTRAKSGVGYCSNVSQVIIHDFANTNTSYLGDVTGIGGSFQSLYWTQPRNCVIYNLLGGTNVRGVDAYNASGACYQCTVYNCGTGGAGVAYGISRSLSGSPVAVNNISVGTYHSAGGTVGDFDGNLTQTTNLSSDASGSIQNKSAANQFVSTVSGSEDLHLKAGADAINAGTDLGTTPTGVNIDIDGRDRDALGDVWDIGADEYVSTGSLYPFAAAQG